MRKFDEEFINAYVEYKALAYLKFEKKITDDEWRKAEQKFFDKGYDDEDVLDFDVQLDTDREKRMAIINKINNYKLKLEKENPKKWKDNIEKENIKKQEGRQKQEEIKRKQYYTIEEATGKYEKLQEALAIDADYVQKLYDSGLKLGNPEYNPDVENDSLVENLKEAAYLHQADEEFIDSLPEKTGKSMVELHKNYNDNLIKALDLSDEDKEYFVKLLAQSNGPLRNNLAALVPAAKQNMKMTIALLEFNEKRLWVNLSDEDITKAVFSDYKNKATIYRLIEVFDKHVTTEGAYEYLSNAIKNFRLGDKEKTIKLVLETAKDNPENMHHVLFNNDAEISAKYDKEERIKACRQHKEEEKKRAQETYQKEREEKEFERKVNQIARDKYNDMKEREEYQNWLKSEGLGLYTEKQILARVQEKRQTEAERRDAALQQKLEDMIADHY